ncbi:MAG TPA: LysR family transcriptional regulator [Streptosporangiaceae bacterium]|nr:LysR family transcriptional regulator [Streptosporangiaceae bacterium]
MAVVHRVAEELHCGRAAERLHITQPALARQIRSSRWLRSSLGVPAGLAVANLIAAPRGRSVDPVRRRPQGE